MTNTDKTTAVFTNGAANATHIPTGKRCRTMTHQSERTYCDFGDAVNPFTWVQTNELRMDAKPGVSDVEYLMLVGKVARLEAEHTSLSAALKALVDWGRDHTSPTDHNSPHQLLIDGIVALHEAKAG